MMQYRTKNNFRNRVVFCGLFKIGQKVSSHVRFSPP